MALGGCRFACYTRSQTARHVSDSQGLHELALEARAAWEANASWWVLRVNSQPGGDAFRRDVLNPAVLSMMPRTGGLVLDLGCGDGYLGRVLGPTGASGVGVDSSRSMIKAANRASMPDHHMRYIVADAEGGLPFSDATFGTVVSSMAAMDVVGLEEIFKHAHRVATSGGTALWIVPDPAGVEESPTSYFDIVRIEPRPVPFAEWAGWVRIAEDQPEPTLYVHRNERAYSSALTRCGWHTDNSGVLSLGVHPQALLLRTRKLG